MELQNVRVASPAPFIHVVTIDRPKALNALDPASQRKVVGVLAEIAWPTALPYIVDLGSRASSTAEVKAACEAAFVQHPAAVEPLMTVVLRAALRRQVVRLWPPRTLMPLTNVTDSR